MIVGTCDIAASHSAFVPPAMLTQHLSAMDSHLGGANSLYEYTAWNVLDGVSRFGRPTDQARLSEILAGSHSLNDLGNFVEAAGLRARFELPSTGGDALERLMSVSGNFLCEGAAYLLGFDFMRETFERASADPEIGGDVRTALERIPRRSFSLLGMNRLFHVLLDRDYGNKVSELLYFPWDRKTFSKADSFVAHPEVIAAIHDVEEEVERTPCETFRERRQSWNKNLGKDDETFFSDLTRALSREFPSLQIILKNEEEMKRMAEELDAEGNTKRQPAMDSERIVADYRLPEENRGRPAIVLLFPGPSRFRLEARSWHEARHLRQALRFGDDWAQKNLLVSEMWAYADETLHCLSCGDLDTYYRPILRYSPFGFGLALRNFVEHLYIRQAPPLT